MAESFACKNDWVHFSNEAVELLYKTWVLLADSHKSAGTNEVKVFLQRLIEEEGAGSRSFGLYGEYLPEEIAAHDQLEALAFLVRKTYDDPTIISEVKWNDQLIESWRMRLKNMLESIEESASLV